MGRSRKLPFFLLYGITETFASILIPRNGIPSSKTLISLSLDVTICSMDHIESLFILVAYVLRTTFSV